MQCVAVRAIKDSQLHSLKTSDLPCQKFYRAFAGIRIQYIPFYSRLSSELAFENIYYAIGGTFRCDSTYSVLQSVASVLQCVASVLQCVATYRCLLRTSTMRLEAHLDVPVNTVCCRVLQACCSVLNVF